MISEMDRALILEFIERFDQVGGRQASASGVEALRHMRDLFSGTISTRANPDPLPVPSSAEFLLGMQGLVRDLRLEYQERSKKSRDGIPDRTSRILKNIAELQEKKTLA
jgi:hypothetical protein